MTATLDREKDALRAEAKARRSALAGDGPAAAEAVVALALRALPEGKPTRVSAYWPIGDELDSRPLLNALAARRCEIGLPVMTGRGEPLAFRLWQPGDALQPGGFGTRIPGEDRPSVRPRVMFVPLLAFDRAGYRLGYGGGFYDRTLQALRPGAVTAIGLAFAGQEVARLPHGPYDQRLDAVVTENAWIECR